jgi:elongation factor 1-beta
MAAQFGASPDLKKLNDFLLSRSYISGWTISGEDVALFKLISAAPSANHENALRWWNHVNSFREAFSGIESSLKSAPAPQAAAKNDEESDEDDDDFFASSDDDEEAAAAAEALKAKRVAEYNARKAEKAAKKGVVAAKSMITLDVKPFDDETDLDALAAKIKSEIAMDGLVWGQKHEKKPLAFGIFKLVVTAVVEDDKVSTDDLTEKIEEYDDEVQSVDIAAFNKL